MDPDGIFNQWGVGRPKSILLLCTQRCWVPVEQNMYGAPVKRRFMQIASLLALTKTGVIRA